MIKCKVKDKPRLRQILLGMWAAALPLYGERGKVVGYVTGLGNTADEAMTDLQERVDAIVKGEKQKPYIRGPRRRYVARK